jgi:hypothetical protein
MSVILATQETEIRRIGVQSLLQEINTSRLNTKKGWQSGLSGRTPA